MSSLEDMFEQLRHACTSFRIDGEGSIDTGYVRATQLKRTMSWTVRYGYSNSEGSAGVEAHPISLTSLCHTTSKRAGDPVAAIMAPYKSVLEQANELLPLATPVGSRLDLHVNKPGSKHLLLIGFDYRNPKRPQTDVAFGHMDANTWSEVEQEVLKFALKHQSFSFSDFQRLMPVNQQKVIDVLNAHPVHNDVTAQIWGRDIANQVVSDHHAPRIKKM